MRSPVRVRRRSSSPVVSRRRRSPVRNRSPRGRPPLRNRSPRGRSPQLHSPRARSPRNRRSPVRRRPSPRARGPRRLSSSPPRRRSSPPNRRPPIRSRRSLSSSSDSSTSSSSASRSDSRTSSSESSPKMRKPQMIPPTAKQEAPVNRNNGQIKVDSSKIEVNKPIDLKPVKIPPKELTKPPVSSEMNKLVDKPLVNPIDKDSNKIAPKNLNSVRVVNVSINLRKEHLEEIFGTYGKIKSINLPVHDGLNLPKGYAYIEYEDTRDAKIAFESMDKGQIDGQTVGINLCDYEIIKKYEADSDNEVSKGGRNGIHNNRPNSPIPRRNDSPAEKRRENLNTAGKRSPGLTSRSTRRPPGRSDSSSSVRRNISSSSTGRKPRSMPNLRHSLSRSRSSRSSS